MMPAFKIVVDGRDVTERVNDRLVSVTVTDMARRAKHQSDAAELKLDNRDMAAGAPRIGASLSIALGYRETGLADMGTYTIDELHLEGPPDTLSVKARAADSATGAPSRIRARRSRSWHGTTLGDVVGRIAAAHGLEAGIATGLAATPIAHEDQTAESDLAFATRLVRAHGGTLKVTGDRRMLVLRTGDGKLGPDDDDGSVIIRRMAGTYLSYKLTIPKRQRAGRTRATHHDWDAALERGASVDDTGEVSEDEGTEADAAVSRCRRRCRRRGGPPRPRRRPRQ